MTDDRLHLSLDELADVLAGEGDDRHLADCADCTGRLAELQAAELAVVARLAALPDPPLPADLARRLDAALTAERPLQPAAGGATVTPLAPRRRQWVPAVAASAVLVLGAVAGYALLHDGVGGSSADTAASSTEAGAGRSAVDALPRSESGTDYGDDAAVKATLPGVLAGTAAFAAALPAPVAGTAAQDATTSAAAAVDPLQRLREPAGLASCLAALLPPEEPDVRPLALDYATFGGQPALAVVLPDPDPAKLSVFVVGPGCSQVDDSTLRFVRVDRP